MLYIPSALSEVASSTSQSIPTLVLTKTTPERCNQTLASLKPGVLYTCYDDIPSHALFAACSVICYRLSSIITSFVASSSFPSTWTCTCIELLHKDSHRSTPSNHCPISILPVSLKLIRNMSITSSHGTSTAATYSILSTM